MKTTSKKSILKGIPSWGLALLTVVVAFVILMVVGQIIASIFKIPEEKGELVFYIFYNLIIAIGCFLICKQNPKSILYVPLLCNVIGILAAIVEPTFWKSGLWIVICSGWAVSLGTALAGYYLGKKKAGG